MDLVLRKELKLCWVCDWDKCFRQNNSATGTIHSDSSTMYFKICSNIGFNIPFLKLEYDWLKWLQLWGTKLLTV